MTIMNMKGEKVMSVEFYKCNHCGNIIFKLHNSGVSVVCCGDRMEELIPGTSDGAAEKHVPAVEEDGRLVHVQVGSVEHPMVDAHYIQWIALESKEGIQVKYLKPGIAPKADFVLSESDELIAVYEYCNIHGLWKKDIRI